MSVAANLARIKETIGNAPVTLIAVTKTVGPEGVEEAFKCGVTEFAENRVQDALDKIAAVNETVAGQIHWHFIGHLQTNKVKKVVGNFSLIHSVDSLNLAQEISKEAQKRQVTQAILVQVKVLPDPGKSGYEIALLKNEFAQLLALPNLKIRGLMTMAPLSGDAAVWHECFSGLKVLRGELEQLHGIELKELYMGMTQDWQEAVRCGATMVRLGRAIFG